jgi:hypothetical protein
MEYYSAIKKELNYVISVDGTGDHVKPSKSGSGKKKKRSHVFSNMWKIHPKIKVYKNTDMYICVYIYIDRQTDRENMFGIVQLCCLRRLEEEGRGKESE